MESSVNLIEVRSLDSDDVVTPENQENVEKTLKNEKKGVSEDDTCENNDKNSTSDNNEVIPEETSYFNAANSNVSTNELKIIPHRKGIKLWNLMKIKRKGYLFYEELMTKYNSSLVKLRMNIDRILINDHISISVMYDKSCVTKDEGFGFMNYNSLMLQNYVPAIFSNGVEHERKKEITLRYINYALSTVELKDIIYMISIEFENMPVYKDLTARQSKRLDFEDIFDKAVGNVITKILLGHSVSHKVLEEWLSKTLEFEYGVDLTDEDEKKITNTVFDLVKACPHINKLPDLTSDSKLSQTDALKEVIWMTTFNAFGGTKSFVLSSLISFLTLPAEDKALIVQEAQSFLSKETPTYEDINSLNTLHSFFLEVARLYPPAATVYGRTTQDLIIKSTTGMYMVPKNNLMCGNLMAVHRDKTLFDSPEKFCLNRPQKVVTDNNYTFGGRFYEQPSKYNHKCPGKELAETIVKLFVIFITKCSIEPIERPYFTGKKMGRFEGSDKPLKIKNFWYTRDCS